jgi:hypothetical protein
MRPRPESVRLVARTHWAVGAAVLGAMALVHFPTRHLPIAFGPPAYAIAGGLATLYGLAGTLVWFGLPPGRALSQVCAMLTLMRPRLCFRLLEVMKLPEFQEHFRR